MSSVHDTPSPTSRSIIWEYAGTYGWTRYADIGGNPGVDAFFRRRPERYAEQPDLLVWYSRDGKRVTDASRKGYKLDRCNRSACMDIIEGRP